MAATVSDTVEILFFGDLVGKPGRKAVKVYLETLDKRPDVVIANVENASHGFGLGERQYIELKEAGIDLFTSGNHIWDRQEIFNYIDRAPDLLRPLNFPGHTPGSGAKVFDVNGVKIGAVNLIGQVFMGNYNSPWDALESAVPALKEETPVLFLDFHGEATAEKKSFAYHAADLGLSAMVGTHTHVQTADNQIIRGQMGYITDAGFNGAFESVIGMDIDSSLRRGRSNLPTRLEVAEGESLQINAVRFWVNKQTGVCQRV